AVLVHDENAGQFRFRFGAGIGTEGPDEIALDAPVSVGRRHSLVGGLDSLVGLGHLLSERVVRHQCVDERRRGQTGHGETLCPFEKITTADLTMNVPVVKFYGFAGNLRSVWLHWG